MEKLELNGGGGGLLLAHLQIAPIPAFDRDGDFLQLNTKRVFEKIREKFTILCVLCCAREKKKKKKKKKPQKKKKKSLNASSLQTLHRREERNEPEFESHRI
jgi:hypothetical protein